MAEHAQMTDRSESKHTAHQEVEQFAHGKGPIVSEEDNTIFKAIKSAVFGDPQTAQKDAMLQQLRKDINYDLNYIDAHKDDPFAYFSCSLLGRDAASSVSERANKEFLSTVETIKNYTPEQMKLIADISAAGKDPDKLKNALAHVSYENSFTDINAGLQLVAEMNNNPNDAPVALEYFSNKQKDGKLADNLYHPKVSIGRHNEAVDVVGNAFRHQM